MKPVFDLVLQRQLESLTTGNSAYLLTFLQAARRADLHIRLVFAPWRSFGNRPWSAIHPGFDHVVDEVIWPRAVRIGRTYWSVSPRIWARFGIRAIKEVLRHLGFNLHIHSYLGDPLDSAEEKLVAATCQADPAEILIAEYSSLAPLLGRLPGHRVRGVLMHDQMSARAAQFRLNDMKADFLEVSVADELEWVKSANLMVYASADEMADFGSQMTGARAIWLCPEPPLYTVSEAVEVPRLVFLGTRHAGNTDSINHFLGDIWPLVRAQLPDIECWIAGSTGKDIAPDYQNLAGVKILGRVEDLADIGGPSSIGLAPTRLASGVSIKVAEYLMLGMTCVAYPKALQGFGDVLNDMVDVSVDKEAFAEAIVALAGNESKRIMQAKTAPAEVARIGRNQPVIDCLREVAAG